MTAFTIGFTVESTLTVAELWPDGDAPANPTVSDVKEAIESYSADPFRVARDWNLDVDGWDIRQDDQ